MTGFASLDGLAYASSIAGKVYAVDLGTGTTSKVYDGTKPIVSLLADGDRLWVTTENGDVAVFDPGRHRFRVIARGLLGPHLAARVIGGALWLVNGASTLSVIDADGTVRDVDIPGEFNDLIECGGGIWLSQQLAGGDLGEAPGLRKIKPDGTVLQEFGAFGEDGPHALGCRGSTLWVASVYGQVGLVDAS